ncbi:hypothetical protein NQ318_008441 [Aromia moschata]|uniref:Maturase K n=1 Tax=Aromia moschata TaxID=1265417 RepID=A0AAV8YAV2_9CUCU|nr:hypothetical protein NQ318_008441 [Aromia moschata]
MLHPTGLAEGVGRAECCPYSALDWLALQVTRNRLVHSWVLSSMDSWLEHFLIGHSNQRVRNISEYFSQFVFLGSRYIPTGFSAFEISIQMYLWSESDGSSDTRQ